MKILVTTLSVFIFLTSVSFAEQGPLSWQNDFEQYVQGLMNEYKVPGFAIAVVGSNGSIFQLKRGSRNLEKNLPVTSETLFAIGSTSKAFTGVILAQLFDQRLVSFDVPVQTYRPDFAIQDPKASKTLTLRDLMGHWTGIGRHDLAWYHRQMTREEMFSLIPELEISTQPRSKFIYNNWMWVASGVVAETVSKRNRKRLKLAYDAN